MNFFRHIKIAALFIAVAIIAPACQDFLEEDPKDRTATSNYYKTEADAVSAVNAIYAHLNSQSGDTFGGVYHSNFWVTIGLASDEMENNRPYLDEDQLAGFTYSSQNGVVYDVWKQHYKAITLANIAIERIPAISMDATLKARLLNEAKFLRGLLYFNMVRMFGEIPLVLKEDESLTPTVAKVDDIYTQVIKDLTDAEALPWDQADGRSRATAGAAKAILAKVYLTRGDYANSAAKSLEVIDSKKYALWDNYADVFKIANRSGKEAIFSVSFGDGGGAISFWETGQFHVRLLPPALATAKITNNTQGWQVPSAALASAYASGDERGPVTTFNKFDETVAGTPYNVPFDKYYFRKYWDVSVAGEFAAKEANNDFQVIRYSDVLLMYAEALNEQTSGSTVAYDYLNMVRNRANLGNLSGLGQDAFRNAVLNERKLEFAAEGQRWFDLVRTHKLEQMVQAAKGVTPTLKHYLFPIPQRERDVNTNLPTNGY